MGLRITCIGELGSRGQKQRQPVRTKKRGGGGNNRRTWLTFVLDYGRTGCSEKSECKKGGQKANRAHGDGIVVYLASRTGVYDPLVSREKGKKERTNR